MTTRRAAFPVSRLIRPAAHAGRLARGWVARQEALVLVAALLIVLAVYGFVELATELREGEMHDFDTWLLLLLRRPDDRTLLIGPRWVAEAVTDFTALGGTAVLTTILLCAVGYLALLRRYGAATLVVVASLGGGLLSLVLKELFARGRPAVVPHLVTVQGLSFPSGHSMASAVIYLTLGALLARFAARRRIRVYVIAVSFGLTFLIGVTRICLGVHYPTDVLAGWAAGLAWALVCWMVARYLQYQGAVEAPGSSGPR